jgi:hypothetical protein
MKTFQAGKSYTEFNYNGKNYPIKCTKVTKLTATFETVYGNKRMKINRTCQPLVETINTSYGTTIEANEVI